MPRKKVIIVGAGPAGLTAGYEALKSGFDVLILEEEKQVGGISKTVEHNGYRFDIGGHRFFSKSELINDWWDNILREKFIRVSRLSRIYYNKKFFAYPLKPFNAFWGLGPIESFFIFLSYVKAKSFPVKDESNFEAWIVNRFGKRLFRTFFKTYTEKVWGVPCNEIKAEWAAQRIKGLSLISAVVNAFFKPKKSKIKTLIDEFKYPVLGPGMMWEEVKFQIKDKGGEIITEAKVKGFRLNGSKFISVLVEINGMAEEIIGDYFLSTMPIRDLIKGIIPEPPKDVLESGGNLNYRDFLTVSLVIDKKDIFPDNWIYIHDPEVKMGRIQNFKNWSKKMVPDENKTCLGLEYFCFEGDDLWNMPDKDLIALGKKEIEQIGFAKQSEVLDGAVVRMKKAYPVYDGGYIENLNIIKNYLSEINNLQLIGRNGMHRYNNQDHSMLTAIYAVRNLAGENNDLWKINADAEYHEESD